MVEPREAPAADDRQLGRLWISVVSQTCMILDGVNVRLRWRTWLSGTYTSFKQQSAIRGFMPDEYVGSVREGGLNTAPIRRHGGLKDSQ